MENLFTLTHASHSVDVRASTFQDLISQIRMHFAGRFEGPPELTTFDESINTDIPVD